MNLPPLADLLALRCADTGRLASLEGAMLRSGRFDDVLRPAASCLLARASLPRGLPAPAADGVVHFAEGAHLFPRPEQVRRLVQAACNDPEGLARFSGDFSLLHFADDSTVVAVRSCGGRVPLYMWQSTGLLAIGTRLSDVIAFAAGDAELDPLAVAAAVAGILVFPDGRTFFRGVTVVPRGHVVRWAAGTAPAVRRYWDPRPPELRPSSPAAAREHAERLRTLLLAHLDEELDSGGGNLLTLSGGVDSSSLAALAAGKLERPVSTLTLLPEAEPYLTEERLYIDNLREQFRFDHSWEFPLTWRHRIEFLLHAPPVAFPVMHPALGLLGKLTKEDHIGVMFGGEFADEVCGSVFTIPDWSRHTRLRDLIAHPRRLPKGPRSVKTWVKDRALRLSGAARFSWPEAPDWLLSEVREEYREWRNQRYAALVRDRRPLRYLALQAEKDAFVAMNWEVTSALGIRRSWPFFTRAMLDLAFECHPAELVGPGTKKLLRAALRDDVPPMNLRRTSRGHWPSPAESLPDPPEESALEAVFRPPGDGPSLPERTFWTWVFAKCAADTRIPP